jgi:hypothetical protein
MISAKLLRGGNGSLAYLEIDEMLEELSLT